METITALTARVAMAKKGAETLKKGADKAGDNKYFKFFIKRHTDAVGDKISKAMEARQEKLKDTFEAAIPDGIKRTLDKVNQYDRISKEKELKKRLDAEAKANALEEKETKRLNKMKEVYAKKYAEKVEKTESSPEKTSSKPKVDPSSPKVGKAGKSDIGFGGMEDAFMSLISTIKEGQQSLIQGKPQPMDRAPKGGIKIDGKQYKGGQFLPGMGMKGGTDKMSGECCKYLKEMAHYAKLQNAREIKRDRFALEKRRDSLFGGAKDKAAGAMSMLKGGKGGGLGGLLGGLFNGLKGVVGLLGAGGSLAAGSAIAKRLGLGRGATPKGPTIKPTTTGAPKGTSTAPKGTSTAPKGSSSSPTRTTREPRAKSGSFKGKIARFMKWLAKKSPKLFAKVAARMAASTAAAATGIGFIITIVGSAWTAWELWDLYQEWEAEEEANGVNESDYETDTFDPSTSPAANPAPAPMSRGQISTPDGQTKLVGADGSAVASRTVTKEYDGDSALSNADFELYKKIIADRKAAVDLMKESEEYQTASSTTRKAMRTRAEMESMQGSIDSNWDAIVAAGAGREVIKESSAADPEVIAAGEKLKELLAGTTDADERARIQSDYDAFIKSKEVDVSADWAARGGMYYTPTKEQGGYVRPDIGNQSTISPTPNRTDSDNFRGGFSGSGEFGDVSEGQSLEQQREAELVKAMDEAGIFDQTERAQIMAQAAHETGGFGVSEESFRYSPERLFELWGEGNSYGNTVRFKTMEDAQRTAASGQEAIANTLYSDRRDLGNQGGSDGYDFRGRGAFQLTGRDNYRAMGEKLGIDLENNPDLISSDPAVGAKVAVQYWQDRVQGRVDPSDTSGVTKLINGGQIGLAHRQDLFAQYQQSGVPLAPGNYLMDNDSQQFNGLAYAPPNQTRLTPNDPQTGTGQENARNTRLAPVEGEKVASNSDSESGGAGNMVANSGNTTVVNNNYPSVSTVHAQYIPAGLA